MTAPKITKPTIKGLEKQMNERAQETDDRITSVESAVSEMTNSLAGKLEIIMSKLEAPKQASSKVMSHIVNKDGTHSEDVYQHQDHLDVNFTKDGPEGDVNLELSSLKSVNDPEFKQKADQMLFDQEYIQIMVMASTSTYPDHTFNIGVNGKLRMIVRNQKIWVPRNYVEVLLRSKVSSYGNQERVNPYNGEREIKNPETKSYRYPLQVLADKNPLGVRWLERVANDMRA